MLGPRERGAFMSVVGVLVIDRVVLEGSYCRSQQCAHPLTWHFLFLKLYLKKKSEHDSLRTVEKNVCHNIVCKSEKWETVQTFVSKAALP